MAERQSCICSSMLSLLRTSCSVLSASGGKVFTDAERARLHTGVEKLYTRVAMAPEGAFHFHIGADYATTLLGYDAAELAALPLTATRSFAGVGNPHTRENIRPGEVVLDVGAGSGTDLLLAARKVGTSGRAIGVDMTEGMISRCRAAITEAGLSNAEIRRGAADSLPVETASVDAVISNGVLNLVLDKQHALDEMLRVLRPGGRLFLSDIVISTRLIRFLRRSTDLWALCVGGAVAEIELVKLATDAGFDRVQVTNRFDCIRGTSKQFVGRLLGISGVNLAAVKPV